MDWLWAGVAIVGGFLLGGIVSRFLKQQFERRRGRIAQLAPAVSSLSFSLLLVIGLLAGTAGTAAVAWLLSAMWVGGGGEAHLVVDAPQGTMILLDGDSVPSDIPIEPGAHRLEIHVRGRKPIVREFEAAPGEQRIFLIEQVE